MSLKKGEVNLGTTIMAVQFNGGVVMGADSRTSTGSYVANRVTDKITKVHDQIFCCRSGSAADTQAIADIVNYYMRLHEIQIGEAPKVSTAANIFSELCYSNRERLLAGIIVAGWDRHNGGTVYNIPLGGSIHRESFAIGGSGSSYIFGYCDSNYNPNFTKEECVQFVINGKMHFIYFSYFFGYFTRWVFWWCCSIGYN